MKLLQLGYGPLHPIKVENGFGDKVKPEDLEHHGIKGMQWGVRRFQKKDGTRTAEGKIREKRKLDVKTRRLLSDGDLKKYVERLEMEKKLKTLTKEDLNSGRTKTLQILGNIGKTAVTAAGGAVATYAIRAALQGHFDPKEAAKFIVPKKK